MKTIKELEKEIDEYNKESIEIKEDFVMLNPKRELAVREFQTLKDVLKSLKKGETKKGIPMENLLNTTKEIEGE